MANNDAGNTLQKAIAAGRARQCEAKCKSTGKQCNRVARNGYNVCQVHGAGSAIREAEGTRKSPGRPVIHGLYSTVLKPDEMDLYNESFGDLTLVHEAALIKVKLAKYLQTMGKDMEDAVCEDDGQVDIESVGKNNKQPQQNKELIFIQMLNATIRTVSAAYDQMRDKKIVVQLQGNEDDIMERVKAAVTKELSFINGQLCPECRRRIIEAVNERTQTIIDV